MLFIYLSMVTCTLDVFPFFLGQFGECVSEASARKRAWRSRTSAAPLHLRSINLPRFLLSYALDKIGGLLIGYAFVEKEKKNRRVVSF